MITDIKMPGCDGLELIRRVKDLQEKMDFIIISGYRFLNMPRTLLNMASVIIC